MKMLNRLLRLNGLFTFPFVARAILALASGMGKADAEAAEAAPQLVRLALGLRLGCRWRQGLIVQAAETRR
jgi:hypothetical protein